MKIKQFLLASLLMALMVGCGSKGTTIEGKIADASMMDVKFDKLKLDKNTMVLASAKSDKNGSFSINMPEGLDAGVYRLRVGSKSISFVTGGEEKNIDITGNYSEYDKYAVDIKGSETASKYTTILNQVANRSAGLPEVKEFVNSSVSPLASMFLLSQSMGQSEQALPLHEEVYSKLSTADGMGEYTKDYATYIASAKQVIAAKAAKEKIKVGQPAPEIALNDPKGKEYKLSDLKGKIVLLDFWASWCGPCRKANPHVVDVYNKYNKKGFEVFSVSLDGLDTRTKARFKDQAQIDQMMKNSKNKWEAAIKADRLSWPYHVSDLKKWESVASGLYGVSSIPKTFLIGRDGNIAAVNPRNNLEEVLIAELAK